MGAPPIPRKHMMNICTKYGFDILIISGSYGEHRRPTPDAGPQTMPRVWHKLPTGKLKIYFDMLQHLPQLSCFQEKSCSTLGDIAKQLS